MNLMVYNNIKAAIITKNRRSDTIRVIMPHLNYLYTHAMTATCLLLELTTHTHYVCS